MIYLGIDPGTATTGFAFIQTTLDKNSYSILEYGVISTPKSDSEEVRLHTLYTDLITLLNKYQPEVVGIEKLFFSTNHKTAISVAQARGICLLACQQEGTTIKEYTPLQVKSTLCGYGKADKAQVQRAVQQTFKLKNVPKPDDAADALALALCATIRNNKTL